MPDRYGDSQKKELEAKRLIKAARKAQSGPHWNARTSKPNYNAISREVGTSHSRIALFDQEFLDGDEVPISDFGIVSKIGKNNVAPDPSETLEVSAEAFLADVVEATRDLAELKEEVAQRIREHEEVLLALGKGGSALRARLRQQEGERWSKERGR